jgi:hypothetical protein
MGIRPRLCLRGSCGTGGANSSSGRACDEATHDRECNCALESARGLDVKARVRFVDMPDSLDPCVLSGNLGQSVHVAPLYVG